MDGWMHNYSHDGLVCFFIGVGLQLVQCMSQHSVKGDPIQFVCVFETETHGFCVFSAVFVAIPY